MAWLERVKLERMEVDAKVEKSYGGVEDWA
jgi:hypothetical protein